MKIMHIASFRGNIGDIQNHKCFYDSIRAYFSSDLEVERIEIREFYFNVGLRKFDAEFANQINRVDLLILGGGGFFDVRWEQSATATSFDISKEFMDSIRVPVLVNAMGYHEYTETQELFCRFEAFLVYALKRKWFISLRNDGSYDRMKHRFPHLDLNAIHVAPDNAFVAVCGRKKRISYETTIGFCLTDDLFDEKYNHEITPEDFLLSITQIIISHLERGHKIVFFTHTPQDVQLISQIMRSIPDIYLRTQVTLSPYDVSTEESVEQYLSYYRLCNVVVAMRFHANIFSITQKIPCIALAGHEQIEGLYRELGLDNQCVVVNNERYAEQLINLMNDALANRNKYVEKEENALITVQKMHSKYIEDVVKYISENGEKEK